MLDNLDPKWRKLALAGLAVGAILLLVTLVYVFVKPGGGGKSGGGGAANGFAREMPDASALVNKNVSSGDFTVMVHARGYLFQYDVGFLPIDVLDVQKVDNKSATGQGQLVARGEHAQLELAYDCGVTRTILKELALLVASQSTDKDGKQVTTYKKLCQLKPDMEISYEPKERFSCPKREIRTCFDLATGKQRVAELLLDSFSVELDGKPETLKRGEFSKPAMKDGCKV